MARPKADLSAKRQAIMEATLAVFSLQGLDATTVDDIAAQAGIAKGAIYLYFNSKDDIYMALLDYTFGELFEEYAQHPEIEDPAEQLEHVFLEGLAEYEEHVTEFRFFLAYLGKCQGKPQGDVIQNKLKESFRRNRKTIEDIYSRGIAQGRFKDMNPVQVSAGLMALSEFIPIQWLVDPRAFRLKEAGRTALTVFMRGIVND